MRLFSMQTCVAVLVALGSVRSFAAGTQPATEAFNVGGTSRLGLPGAASVTARRSWRVEDFRNGAGRISRLEGPALDVTFAPKGAENLLTLDGASLDQLASELRDDVEDRLLTNATVTITRQRVTARPNADRGSRRIAARLSFTATLRGRASVRGTFTFTANGTPRRVLVLDDSANSATGSGIQVAAALGKAGHFAIDGGWYQTWNGAKPSLDGVDAVYLLQGVESEHKMTTEGDAALTAWVEAGGGLLRTEPATEVVGDSETLALDALLPAVSLSGESDFGGTWTVEDPTHLLVRGVRHRFAVPYAQWAKVTPIEGAEVVVRNAFGYPMVTWADFGAGTVVHVNHDLRRGTGTIEPQILKILVNAATYLGL